MLFEAAIGDAYGSGYEFRELEFIREHNHTLQYHPHAFWEDLTPGRYTDDTQMTIAVAEALLAGASTQLEFADHFVACFRRDPRGGYSRKFFDLISEIRTGQELLDRIVPKGTTCGAAMRSLPLGFLPLDKIAEVAKVQASVTHNSTQGIRSSQAIALAAYHMRKTQENRTVREFVGDHLKTTMFDTIWSGPVTTESIDVVCAVFNVVETSSFQHEALQKSISFSGDVDSVAALACGLLAPKISDIPQHLVAQFEQGPYTREYIVQLERQLDEVL